LNIFIKNDIINIMNKQIYADRMEKIQKAMMKEGIDVYMAGPSANLYYLTGYDVDPDERMFLLVLPKNGEPLIVANLLYKGQAIALPVKKQVYWRDGDDPFVFLKSNISMLNIKMNTAALEPHIPSFISLPLQEVFNETRFLLGDSLTAPIRQVKDDNEIDLIRTACQKSDAALSTLIQRGSSWLGKTEIDFYKELSAEFSKNDMTSFGASVQVGENAYIPHYITGTAQIKKGACLLVDFWGRNNGYFTDCTRTFHFGEPSEEFKKVYAIVLEAHYAACEKARAGNTLEDVDIAARSIIKKYGYGDNFTHRTGHGIGIDIHEGDSVNTGVNVPITPGMVFSVEPGIYLNGRFGVRIENLVAIRENSTEVLHKFPMELQVIE